MACFHPLAAWRQDDGKITFVDLGSGRLLHLPCGRCIGCRLVRQRSWALRCLHEAQMHDRNCFVTLTFDEAHYQPSLNYLDFQLFMKRLRKEVGPTRFFVCGEYGDHTLRPHYHALLFGRTFSGPSVGKDLISSPLLQKLWPFGFNSVGNITYDSAAYVARYSCKKVTGPPARAHYTRVDLRTGEYVQVLPEFGHMSLKPGLGYTWFQKYWRDVYNTRDGVVRPGGSVCPPPRYYDTLLHVTAPNLSTDKEYDRYIHSQNFLDDCTPERLLVREKCALAKQKFLKRATL